MSSSKENISIVKQVLKLAGIETSTYLRDRTSFFWTFLYPIVLLVILMAFFGSDQGGRFGAVLDIENNSNGADRFVTTIENRFSEIPGANFSIRYVTSNEETPKNRVRITLPNDFDPSPSAPATIVVQLDGAVDASSGTILTMLSELTAEMNMILSAAPKSISLAYEISGTNVQAAQSSNVYFVVGLAVLTMVSTALFGFTGVLIDLRVRGGMKLFQFMPMRRSVFLVSFGLCRLIVLSVFCLLFIFGGLAIYGGLGLVSPNAWLLLLLLIVVGAISFLSTGLLVAGLITKNSTASVIINFANLPIMFLSDLFIPIELLPETVQMIAKVSPVYLLVDSMRNVALGEMVFVDCLPVLLSLLGLCILSVVVVVFTFRWRMPR